MKGYLQQGDVLFHRVATIPKANVKRVHDPVVQHGEHTGHAHRLAFRHGEKMGSAAMDAHATNWEIVVDKTTGERFLSVKKEPVALSHEEHKTISIPPGNYRIGIVQEYDHFAEEARQVMD